MPTLRLATSGATTDLSIKRAGAVHPFARIYYIKNPLTDIQKLVCTKNIKASAGRSTTCLAIQTYGIVIGFSSDKIPMRITEKIFDAKLPIKIAMDVYTEY